MGRVATVEIEHKKTGVRRIVNKEDLGQYPDFKKVEARSVADQEAVEEKAEEAALNETLKEADDSPEEPEPDWRDMKWPEARAFVEEKTGTKPKSKAEAEELMTGQDGAV